MEHRERARVKATLAIHFRELARRPEIYDDVHQILMTSDTYVNFSYGTQVTSLPYEEIRELRVEFDFE